MAKRTQSTKRTTKAVARPSRFRPYTAQKNAAEDRKARIGYFLADTWAKSPAGVKYSDIEAAFARGEIKMPSAKHTGVQP